MQPSLVVQASSPPILVLLRLVSCHPYVHIVSCPTRVYFGLPLRCVVELSVSRVNVSNTGVIVFCIFVWFFLFISWRCSLPWSCDCIVGLLGSK